MFSDTDGATMHYQTERLAQIQRMMERVAAEAERQSDFSQGELVLVERPKGFTVADDASIEYEDRDPKKYFRSRIYGWDGLGRPEVFTTQSESHHWPKWPWGEERFQSLADEDWLPESSHKISDEILFTWEIPDHSIPIGYMTTAKLHFPHVAPGDWVIAFQDPHGTDTWRVLNESQFEQ